MGAEIRKRRRCRRTLRQVRLFKSLAGHEVLPHGNGRVMPHRERHRVCRQPGKRMSDRLRIARRPEDAVDATALMEPKKFSRSRRNTTSELVWPSAKVTA